MNKKQFDEITEGLAAGSSMVWEIQDEPGIDGPLDGFHLGIEYQNFKQGPTVPAKNAGGPAFAWAVENGHQEGMPQRDWFAGMALHGFKSRSDVLNWDADTMAQAAYRQADAMLKAREDEG